MVVVVENLMSDGYVFFSHVSDYGQYFLIENSFPNLSGLCMADCSCYKKNQVYSTVLKTSEAKLRICSPLEYLLF